MVGYPNRCKDCNRKYQTYKRAREAVDRLYFVKPANDGWEYLKFVTITREKMESVNEFPSHDELQEFKKWYVQGRDKIRDELQLLGGTDVVECVTHKLENGMYHHNFHIHGIWIMPHMKISRWRKAFDSVGFGRDQIRAIKSQEYECQRTGELKEWSARKCAIFYLAKYLTKSQQSRRMMWGEVRRWKNHFDSDAPKNLKSMFAYEQWRCEKLESMK